MLIHNLTCLLMLAQAPLPGAHAGVASNAGAAELGIGWNSLAAGRAADAEKAADAVLRAGHARHDAFSLKIRARLLAGQVNGALDAYDQWSQNAREDVFLLQPIAAAVLSSLAASNQPDVRRAAIEALARSGDAGARAALEKAEVSIESDATLAALGDQRAVTRLRENIAHPTPGIDQEAAIDALVDAKATAAAPELIAALDPSRPAPVRAAAARGLGVFEADESRTKLREALNDPDGLVRASAAVALARMGDQAGSTIVAQMENSPVTDVRLLAAEASAAEGASGAWTGTATAALRDPDPLTRLSAAQLLLRHAPESAGALDAVRAGLTETNPAVRHVAAKIMSNAPAQALTLDVGLLKRMLIDSSVDVRVAAATALLRLAGGTE